MINEPAQPDGAPPAGTDAAVGETTSAGPADSPDPAVELENAVEVLRNEAEAMRLRLAEAQDRVLRIQAEADNQRKRAARDVENAHKYALERFVADLIPVVDSLELGIGAITGSGPEIDTLRQGMDLTLKKFQDTLTRYGVVVINPAGEKFNPERHEAVSALPQEGAEPNTVLTVMQKGYELNGRLVRPAMVVIAKGS